MALAVGSSEVGPKTKPAWLWCAVSGGHGAPLQHPADIPRDQGHHLAAEQLETGGRGPNLARLSAVTLLHAKTLAPGTCLVARDGATQEVARTRLLPWHEGLLLIQELLTQDENIGCLRADWADSEHRCALEKACKGKRRLTCSRYVEQRLLDVSATGAAFIDGQAREWRYRRDGILANAREDVALADAGAEESGFFRMQRICRYIPPWQAICHPKCGYYQDFYQVLWSHPYSEVDYSHCENGSRDMTGATWEPDECIPACLDRERIQAKRTWHAEQLALEGKSKRPLGEFSWPAVKRRCTRRDGKPLERDLLRSSIGHDLVLPPEGALGSVRKGWPMRPQDYPPGFGVLSPPGFCKSTCDCMDDQRPQRKWETQKIWIEDHGRTGAVKTAIDSLSLQKSFVKRKGDGKVLCYFETVEKYMFRSLQPLARAALDLANTVQDTLKQACAVIPIQALTVRGEPICFPASVYSPENYDVVPLVTSATLEDGAALPKWLILDAATGELSASRAPQGLADLHVRLRFQFVSTVTMDVACIISSTAPHSGVDTPWATALPPVVEKFASQSCAIDGQLRAIILERLSRLYDFRVQRPREVSLKQFLDVLSRCLRMLRSASVANLTTKA